MKYEEEEIEEPTDYLFIPDMEDETETDDESDSEDGEWY